MCESILYPMDVKSFYIGWWTTRSRMD